MEAEDEGVLSVSKLLNVETTIKMLDDLVQAAKAIQDRYDFLNGLLSKHDIILSNIDHELEIKTLKAHQYSKIMAYQKKVVLSRREVKEEQRAIKTLTDNIGLTQLRSQSGNARKKLIRLKAVVAEDTGVIDSILEGGDPLGKSLETAQ